MKKKTQIVLPLLISFSMIFQTVYADKILVLTFFSSKSHKITYMGLLEELASRGHEITIVSPVKSTKEVKNIKEIYTFDTKEAFKFNAFELKEGKGKVSNPFFLLEEFGAVCKRTYDLPHVMDILKEKFDMVFMQPLFNDCALGMAYRFKAPLVFFFPTSAPSFLLSKLGGYLPPSVTPNLFMGYSEEMTFYERFLNFGMDILMEAQLRFSYEPYMAAIYQENLGSDIPSVREIISNASLVLSNGHFSVNKPKTHYPDVVDIGGIHSRPAKPLPKDLEDFVTKSGKDGFILFSMGSAIKGDQMPDEKRKLFLNAFSKLRQQVLWKWESETMPDLPKNVKLSKWLPQQDLLGHPNIKMFITHCGGGSTEEAIYHGVPLLGLPMFGDQPLNAMQAERNGISLNKEWNDLTEKELLAGIMEVLNNPKYRNNVQKLSEIFKDQPDDPLTRGTYWIEYILRHKGAPHLRSAARKLNYFQYHSWDVVAAYLTVILVAFYLLLSILLLLFRKVCRCGSKKASKSLKQKITKKLK